MNENPERKNEFVNATPQTSTQSQSTMADLLTAIAAQQRARIEALRALASRIGN